jgi:hypothetical protein
VLSLVVALSGPAPAPVSMTYATTAGTAQPAVDYATATGTVSFATGASTQTINIITLGDYIDEDDETFRVLLSNPVGVNILDGDGLATIVDNDQSSVSVADVAVNEGDSGSVLAAFTVSMSTPNSRQVTVAFTTANGTAVSGADYTAISGVLTFAPGVQSQTVSVPVMGDTLDEVGEIFSLNLSSPTLATIGRAKGYGAINDDDDAPSVTIADISITEGHSVSTALLTLTLSVPSGQTVRVQFTTADGTAVAGADYQTRLGEVQFAPGVLTRTIPVTIVGDRVAEANESFFVNLTSASAATLADAQATVTIGNDDGTP